MTSTPPPPPGPPGAPGYGSPAAPPGYSPPGYGYGSAVRPFRRNAMLILAQVLAIIQGVLFMLLGIGVILIGVLGRDQLQNYINQHPNAFNNANGAVQLTNVASGVVIGVGAVIFVIFAIVTFLGIRAGRPSQAARWILAIIEILLLLGSIRGLGGGSYGTIVFVVWEALIIIGLIIWPTTYAAYSRRNLPAATY